MLYPVIHSLRQRKHHGLPIWPFFGMLPSLINGLRTHVYEMTTTVLQNQNWTYKFKGARLTNFDAVVTSDPCNIEYMLKTKFTNFVKGEFSYTHMCDLLGDGIFNVDGDMWRRQRKISSLYFHSVEFRSMMEDSLAKLIHSRLLPILEDFIKQSKSFDLQDLLLRLTFDNVCIITLGVDPGCLRTGLPEIPFAKAFETATDAMMIRFNTPMFLWKAMQHLDLGWERKLKTSIRQVDEFANKILHTRKNEIYSTLDAKKSSRDRDLLTVFMESKDDEGKLYTDKFLRDICISFILAGRDTSAIALTWFFWLLHQYPRAEEQIFTEICQILGQRENLKMKEDTDSITFMPEEIKKMDYLQATLSETLRLYPSVPIDSKEALEDDMLPNGTKLKKGARVLYSIYTMGRMENLWGKDCKGFKPERWLKDGKFMNESPYKFMAFHAGPRLCLGKDFAYYQMKVIAASIIYRYRVKVVENHPVTYRLSLTYYMKYGLN
ncbi:hypothetical protein AQUCO_00400229v1, partial [Aquilegia coerulea]